MIVILLSVVTYGYLHLPEGFDSPAPLAPPDTTGAAGTAATGSETPGELAQKASLLRDIRGIVRNELLQSRAMTSAGFPGTDTAGVTGEGSPAITQGAELTEKKKSWCPRDPNKYVRKDAIPCWGCTLDY